MLFKLVMPETRKESRFPNFRRRIPKDVLPQLRGRTLTIPVGDETTTVRISEGREAIRVSLRTTDPAQAKERHAQIYAHLEAIYRGIREGTRRLTHKEVLALAGEAYHVTRNFGWHRRGLGGIFRD